MAIAAARCLLLSLALLSLGAPLAAATPDAGQFFDSTFGDLAEELATARAEGKQGLLLMFEMDDCPFCHRMKETVLNQPEIQAFYRQHFRILPVDVEGDIELTDFAGQTISEKDFALKTHRVRATPVFAFFDLDGNLAARYTGATRDATEFLWLGEYVVQGRYRELSFPNYRRERQGQSGATPAGEPADDSGQ